MLQFLHNALRDGCLWESQINEGKPALDCSAKTSIFFPQHIVTANSPCPRPRDKSASLDKTPSSASLASILFSHCLFSINVARGSICLVRAGKGGVGYLSLWRLHGEHGHLTGEQRTPERRHRPPFALSARPSRWVLLPWNKEQKKKIIFLFFHSGATLCCCLISLLCLLTAQVSSMKKFSSAVNSPPPEPCQTTQN